MSNEQASNEVMDKITESSALSVDKVMKIVGTEKDDVIETASNNAKTWINAVIKITLSSTDQFSDETYAHAYDQIAERTEQHGGTPRDAVFQTIKWAHKEVQRFLVTQAHGTTKGV